MKHAPVLVKLDGQHFSLPNGGEVIFIKIKKTKALYIDGQLEVIQ